MSFLQKLFSFIAGALRKSSEPITEQQLIEARDYVAERFFVEPHRIPLPRIRQDSEQIMTIARIMKLTNPRSIVAMYLPGTMIVGSNFNRLVHMPHLIHEMTHHAQYILGIKYSNTAEKEVEAYHNQNAYADLHGIWNAKVTEDFIRKVTNT